MLRTTNGLSIIIPTLYVRKHSEFTDEESLREGPIIGIGGRISAQVHLFPFCYTTQPSYVQIDITIPVFRIVKSRFGDTR